MRPPAEQASASAEVLRGPRPLPPQLAVDNFDDVLAVVGILWNYIRNLHVQFLSQSTFGLYPSVLVRKKGNLKDSFFARYLPAKLQSLLNPILGNTSHCAKNT